MCVCVCVCTSLEHLRVCQGFQFMLMGAAEEVTHPKPNEKSADTGSTDTSGKSGAASGGDIVAPTGLVNLGNTCYMNASLQCLRAMPELTSALKGFSVDAKTLNRAEDRASSVLVSLRELFKFLEKSENGVPPLLLLKSFREAFPQFAQQDDHGNFAQQDAEECWAQLLWCLGQKLPALKQSDAFKSFVEEHLTGEIQSVWKCKNASDEPETKTHETFDRLPCHISKGKAW
jgi:ubiquitin carboxyl-terminal hydrolase 14